MCPTGQQQTKTKTGRAAKPPAFKTPLPATPENLPEYHGSLESLPELQLSMDSIISSSGSRVGTSIALGNTGLTRSTGGSDALNRSTASTIGAKSQPSDANRTMLLSGPHRLSQTSTVDGTRVSFDTRKLEDDIRTSLESESAISPLASPSDPSSSKPSGSPLWRNVVLAHNSAVPAPRTQQPTNAADPTSIAAAAAAASSCTDSSHESKTGIAVDALQKRLSSESGRKADGSATSSAPGQRPNLHVDVRSQSCNLDGENVRAMAIV